MLSRRFSFKRVVELTGLEESKIRCYESAFKEFLTFTRMGMDDNEFNEDHIEILNRIKSLIHKRGFPVVEVKKELNLTLKSFRLKSSTGFPPSKPSGYARVIGVTSDKGGVGETAIAADLAGSVGRELCNALGVVPNVIYYLKSIRTYAEEGTKEYLDIVTSDVSNSGKIVADLPDFSRDRIVEKMTFPNEMNELLGFPVSLSIGTAYWSPDSSESIEEALSRADKRMYEEKIRQTALDQSQ